MVKERGARGGYAHTQTTEKRPESTFLKAWERIRPESTFLKAWERIRPESTFLKAWERIRPESTFLKAWERISHTVRQAFTKTRTRKDTPDNHKDLEEERRETRGITEVPEAGKRSRPTSAEQTTTTTYRPTSEALEEERRREDTEEEESLSHTFLSAAENKVEETGEQGEQENKVEETGEQGEQENKVEETGEQGEQENKVEETGEQGEQENKVEETGEQENKVEEPEAVKERVEHVRDVQPENIGERTNNRFWSDDDDGGVCALTANPNTANGHVSLSEDDRKATCVAEERRYAAHPERFGHWEQVLCGPAPTGRRCYWEVELSGWVSVAVAYGGMDRRGPHDDSLFGYNDRSWSLECDRRRRRGYAYSARHNGQATALPVGPPDSNRVGVALDWPAGSLSFYGVRADSSRTHLYTFQSRFTEPLYPGFGFLSYGSSVSL